MSRVTLLAAAVVLLGASSSARAQSWELSGFTSYTPSSELEHVAPQLDDLAIRDGFTWGVQGARAFGDHWAAEGIWAQQHSALETGTAAGATDLFSMTIGQLHGNAVYQFGGRRARVRPFAFGGLGATFFRADDLQSEVKLSLGVGGGIKYFLSDLIGIRGHFRYKPILLDDEDAGTYCDPFGFCQSTMRQFEIAAGAVVRF
jgi:Outer membrane protein beta-barrel domain